MDGWASLAHGRIKDDFFGGGGGKTYLKREKKNSYKKKNVFSSNKKRPTGFYNKLDTIFHFILPPPHPNSGYALEDFFASKWRTTVSNWGRRIGLCIIMRGANEKYTDKKTYVYHRNAAKNAQYLVQKSATLCFFFITNDFL